MKHSEYLAAISLKKVRDAQRDLYEVWGGWPECLEFKQFEQLKQALRDMEDYFMDIVQIEFLEEKQP